MKRLSIALGVTALFAVVALPSESAYAGKCIWPFCKKRAHKHYCGHSGHGCGDHYDRDDDHDWGDDHDWCDDCRITDPIDCIWCGFWRGVGCVWHGLWHPCCHDRSYPGPFYRAAEYGAPVATMVPPSAKDHFVYTQGVPSVRLEPIPAHLERAGRAQVIVGSAAEHPTRPFWPTSTQQFGYYNIRPPREPGVWQSW